MFVKRKIDVKKPNGEIDFCVNAGRFRHEFVGDTAVLKDKKNVVFLVEFCLECRVLLQRNIFNEFFHRFEFENRFEQIRTDHFDFSRQIQQINVLKTRRQSKEKLKTMIYQNLLTDEKRRQRRKTRRTNSDQIDLFVRFDQRLFSNR